MLFNRCAFYDLADEAFEELKPKEKLYICAHQKTLTWDTARKRLGLGSLYSESMPNSALLAPTRRIYRTRAKK